jgi:hypothetical protein
VEYTPSIQTGSHADQFTSSTAFSTSRRNRDIAAVSDNVANFQAAKDMETARVLLGHPQMHDILEAIENFTTLTANKIIHMLIRASASEYSDSIADNICSIPWWEHLLKKYEGFGIGTLTSSAPDSGSGSDCSGDPVPKRRNVTAWGDQKCCFRS